MPGLAANHSPFILSGYQTRRRVPCLETYRNIIPTNVEFQDSEQNLIKLTGVVRWSEDGGADGGSDSTPRFGVLIDRPISKAYLAFLKGLLAGPEA